MNDTRTAVETALSSPGHDFPAVQLVELVERAAARLMRRRLAPGQNSVAVAMNVRRVADTDTPFADWNVTVRLTAVRGRLHDFVVEVCDDSGQIARAEHTRAVVVEHRLVAMARRRAGRPAMLLQA